MKLSTCLAAVAAVAVSHASPHPALGQQQTLGVSQHAPQTSISDKFDQTDASFIDQDPLLSFHRDLVSIESVSGNEHDVGIFIAKFLEAKNFTVIKQEVAPVKKKGVGAQDEDQTPKTRYNIYAYPSSLREQPSILVTSHIDTVPPFIPYSVHKPESSTVQSNLDEYVIAGRGTVDAKGSVAAQVYAVLETLEAHPDAKLGLLFVVGEEIGGDGMKTFSESEINAKSAYHTVIFGEPTEAKLVSGHKGMLGFEVLAHGKAAHSGYPWLGKSAVSAILPALSRVDQLGNIPVSKGGLPSSEKYGPTTLNIGTIRAGVATNVVPATAHADVAVRLAAGTVEEARELIQKAVKEATRDVEAEVKVDFSNHNEAYSPQDLDTDVDGFEVMPVNYGTDVPNLTVRDGVKRYLYGPGSIFVAHGDNEALTVRDIKDAVKGFKKLINAALDRD
ncbi:putative carboxypeptidase [Penicillium oxalicum]|uniref:putative carboxypeptidase n=1 Tax=Penicillium oxalicum TaxID=69781 RepID=UPI0020B8DA5F|nr:putative carboxypeptidase [Penicillium oxalicum]KAI2788567.1 putative carboxypeptidase [Penicillium oxalicum]